MTNILVISDDGVATGYGRISMEINRRLVQRGHTVFALSLTYDGLLPAQLDGRPLPYWVGSLPGKDMNNTLVNVINAIQPDIVHVIQDAPYAMMVRNAPVDWSKHALVITTPVDGVPVYKHWIALFKQADAMMTISEFGVQAHKAAGVRSVLCRPGVDTNVFYRYPDERRAELRKLLDLPEDAFVLMTAAQNQGRKAIPAMLEGFFDFCEDKPDARYLLDMDKVSPAGWDVLTTCEQEGWDTGRLIFREDAVRRGVTSLADRYNVADVHAVLAFREGYGLPLVEAMATGAVGAAMDYCSGTEICGDGKGALIDKLPFHTISTWGGAWDHFPDVDHFAGWLDRLYRNPHERAMIGARGMEWARSHTWDHATDAVQGVYDRVIARRKHRTYSMPPDEPPDMPTLANLLGEQYRPPAPPVMHPAPNLMGVPVMVDPTLEPDEWRLQSTERLRLESANREAQQKALDEWSALNMPPQHALRGSLQFDANPLIFPHAEMRADGVGIVAPLQGDPLFPPQDDRPDPAMGPPFGQKRGWVAEHGLYRWYGPGDPPVQYSGIGPHDLIVLGLDPNVAHTPEEIEAALDRYRRESDAPTAPALDEDGGL